MKKILYLRFNDDQLDLVLKSNNEYQVLDGLSKSINYDKLVVFLPASLVTWYLLTIKVQNNKQRKSAIPFALVSVMTEGLNEVYYQYRYQKEQTTVAVIKKSTLDHYLAKLVSLNIKADYLISEFEALTKQESITIFDKNEVIIKQNEHYYGIDTQILNTNNLSILDQLEPNTIHYAHHEIIDEYALNNATPVDNMLIFLAQSTPLDNTLNFANLFSGYTRWLKQIKPFVLLLFLVSSLLISYPVLLWLEQDESQKQINNTNQKMIQLYQTVDANAKRIFDPYSQLLSLSKVQNKQREDNFLFMLYLLEQYFQPDINIERLGYEKQYITIIISSKNLSQLEQFNQKLNNHFQVRTKSSTQHQQLTKMILELRLKK